MGVLPDFFSRKESDTIKKLKEQINAAKKTTKIKAKPKKVSKPKKTGQNTKKQKETVIPTNTSSSSSVIKSPLPVESLTFFSQQVRRVYYKNRWVFFLEDIVALTGTIDLNPYLDKLRKCKEYLDNSGKYVSDPPVLIEGKTNFVECITYEGVMWLLPILRTDERTFQGPFTSWIKEASLSPVPLLYNN